MNGSQAGAHGEGTAVATLGGGCFWCLEAVFERLQGVERVVSGYAGGTTPDPTYRQVCSGATGHAEVVQVHFDPDRVSYRDLLRVFFTLHDPTTRDRQGADVGSQYRSIVLHHSDEQRRVAEEVMSEMQAEGLWDAPFVTELVPLERFYAAEDYHQGYYGRNPDQGYCRVVIDPKVAKLRKEFADRLGPVPAP
ncbi:MAG TPA: peptide-methionine (S)-S-oxide reductase MsrA [Candidatus Thermoplasmatota archaeon]